MSSIANALGERSAFNPITNVDSSRHVGAPVPPSSVFAFGAAPNAYPPPWLSLKPVNNPYPMPISTSFSARPPAPLVNSMPAGIMQLSSQPPAEQRTAPPSIAIARPAASEGSPPVAPSPPTVIAIPEGPEHPQQAAPSYPSATGDGAWNASAPKAQERPGLREPESHAQRHPFEPIIEPRKRGSRAKKSEARAGDAELLRKARQTLALNLLKDDVAGLAKRIETLMQELAVKHSVSRDEVRRLLYKPVAAKKATSKISLWNAKLHHKAEELRDGKELEGLSGDEKRKYIRDAVKADNELNELQEGTSEADALLEAVAEKRDVDRVGVRATNKAAAGDFNGTANRLGEEIQSAYRRHGARSLILFAKGHPSDSGTPRAILSGDTAVFCKEILKFPPTTLAFMFEHWSLKRAVEPTRAAAAADLKKAALELIKSRLMDVTGIIDLPMQYVNFDEMQLEHGIKLVGWPEAVKFTTPADLNAKDLRVLVPLLREGECRFEVMSRAERQEVEARVAAKPKKKRAPRSDINGTHRRKGKENSSEAPAPKRAKTGGSTATKSKGKQKAAGPKSAEFVADDSDDDEGAEVQRTGVSSSASRRACSPSDSESSDEE
ncbi:hypothetical protein CPB85DRAFT_1562603 [Mucidula mucida]|nr:hypothetical protein CPB85DRAFT_1562603 [Mucidula mucida]